MIVKLLTEHHLEFLSLKGGSRGSSGFTLVKCQIVGNLMQWLNYINLFATLCFHHNPKVHVIHVHTRIQNIPPVGRGEGHHSDFIYLFNHQRFSQRAIRTSLEKQLVPLDPIASRGGP